MAVSEVMTLNFFWMVKDEGSWLDIGTTISHFVIGSLLCVFVAGLEFLSEVLISGVEVDMRDAQQFGGAEPEDLALELDARTSSAPEDTRAEKPQKLAN